MGLVGSSLVIVTNRHVAAEFARRDGAGFVFRQGLLGRPMAASIDFRREVEPSEPLKFSVERVLHIEDDPGPDLAFLRVTPKGGKALPKKIDLGAEATEDDLVAVIGYPARDSRVPEQALMDEIFGDIYDKKRLAPGRITRCSGQSICHDCSTLGGNSGSVVLSLKNGNAVGLHFAGRFLENNFAVPVAIIQERLDAVLAGGPVTRSRPVERTSEPARQSNQPGRANAKVASFIVPLRITVEIGEPQTGPARASAAVRVLAGQAGDDQEDVITEGLPEDYRDRQGYQEDFLGREARVPLPEVRHGADVLTFPLDGKKECILCYEHFSVCMSKSRRLCIYSAVNIDGKRSKAMARAPWRSDPRIPLSAQIRSGCYGNAPRFSRGHMTRREDPIWGADASATKGNQDSMHLTNSVPQMQPFNAGIWLELENYALQHARGDDMKISVFTGPILVAGDPTLFGVQIPVEFWKVIAFIHDETGELCATGYSLSQSDFLREEEFVFGKHKTAQRRIGWIEQHAGLRFPSLAERDPFREREGVESELVSPDQLQFL